MTNNETKDLLADSKAKDCEFCDFNRAEEHEWEIELYKCGSYKYEGYKYYLEVTYPSDGKWHKQTKGVEVYYCPKCGRKL